MESLTFILQARNGLLLHSRVKKALDAGAICIVPDLLDDPTTEQVARWEQATVKDYRWRLIDEDSESLQELIAHPPTLSDCMYISNLNGKKLFFKNDNRPRARYLYFLFVVAQLRMAWRQGHRKDPAKILKPQLGKSFWATRRRYLNRALLLALAEEIGHDSSIPENVSHLPGMVHDTAPTYDEVEDKDLALVAVAKIVQAQIQSEKYDDEDEDEEEEEDEASD